MLVYGLDKSGEYSILHHAFVCGPGQTTPIGTFRTPFKAAWHPLQGCWGQYCTQIVGNYLFHSSPYNSPNKNDLSYRLYNQLGTVCSHGCVRLTVADAKWIYDNCPLGTTVKIYNASSLPVPKPSAPWLDITSPNRGWDPTDPDRRTRGDNKTIPRSDQLRGISVQVSKRTIVHSVSALYRHTNAPSSAAVYLSVTVFVSLTAFG